MKIAVITGASSGIGKEFALQMDRAFHNIDEFWLIARREEELKNLTSVLTHKTRCFPLDITVKKSLTKLDRAIYKEKATVSILINCAGYGLMGDFASMDRLGALGMIRLNCEALTDLTHRMLPHMKKNSRIIQLASSAAFIPQADFAVYAATKSYVLSFSRALNRELKQRKIYVTAVCPGPVDTPFFEIAEKNGSTLAIKKLTMVSPEDVVAKTLRDSYLRKSKSVCSIPIMLLDVGAKMLPHEVLLEGMSILKTLERKEIK